MFYDDTAQQLINMGFIHGVDFFNAQNILFHIRGEQ